MTVGQQEAQAQLAAARKLLAELQGASASSAGALQQALASVAAEVEGCRGRVVLLEQETGKVDAKVCGTAGVAAQLAGSY